MESHDLVFWTDIDTLIMNPNVRRARWAPRAGRELPLCVLCGARANG